VLVKRGFGFSGRSEKWESHTTHPRRLGIIIGLYGLWRTMEYLSFSAHALLISLIILQQIGVSLNWLSV